jgi:hypothetical protein
MNDDSARQLILDAADHVARTRAADWRWPESTLTYSNAILPHAALVVATVLDDEERVADALALLAWLVARESHGERFSFTPVGGRSATSTAPAFDQQPIEAWAMIEACSFAYDVTKESLWAESATRAGQWFTGRNDVGVRVYDPQTGGGYDGLGPHGPNLNQGAESTIAFNATMMRLHSLGARAQSSSGAQSVK